MTNIIFSKDKILFYFFLIFFLEILSFFTWQLPFLRWPIFVILGLVILFVTWRNLNYGLLIASGELMIGSFGYLFNADIFGQTISWRMAIWMIILLIWFKVIFINKNSLLFFYKENKKIILTFIFLVVLLLHSVIRGLMKNDFLDVILDANAWLYLALFLPWLMFNKKYLIELWQIMSAAVIWLFFKTALLLYVFSHNFFQLTDNLYSWTRDFRLGEITFAGGNFWRIFMQSQSFTLFITIVFIYLAWLMFNNFTERKNYFSVVILLILSLSVVLMSYSRSFWLTLFISIIALLIFILYKKNKVINFLKFNFQIAAFFVAAIFIVFLIVNFPWPKVDSSQTSIFINRLQNPTNEAAGNARLNQLQPLLNAISKAPLFGQGFGAKVNYHSTDPRIVALGDDYAANYSTYAFEWGYLDIWLKLGLLGIFVYLVFIYYIIKRSYHLDNVLAIAFIFGFMAILITNITTPYLNHPLGMGVIFWLIATGNKLDFFSDGTT